MDFAHNLMILRCRIIDCVDSLGYSEHSGVLDSVVAPTTAEI